jgi:hypothetical protein
LGLVALAVRAHGLHVGLIYPDGYQYLLMARGIATHLTPVARLGHGGALFVPSTDAALKPLFPALVALLHPLAGYRSAADALTVVAGAATVVLAAALAERLTGSRLAALLAAGAALVSQPLAYWSGFTGPDPLAEALALASALAAVSDRRIAAGILGALCAATRPEWGVVLLGVALAALARGATRPMAATALVSAAFTLAALLGLIRPPLATPPGGLLLLVGVITASAVLQALLAAASMNPRRAAAAASLLLAATAAVALSGSVSALNQLLAEQWPLLTLAAGGVLGACFCGRARSALMLLGGALTLGAIYVYRNAGSERYLAELIPLASVACGFVALALRAQSQPVRFALPAGALGLALLLGSAPPAVGRDTFAVLAGELTHAPGGTLVSAAPDAYGFLLPSRPQQALARGARGLILLDPAQRAYDPGLSARGVVLERLALPDGFERPDGTLDTGGAILVRGVVTAGR